MHELVFAYKLIICMNLYLHTSSSTAWLVFA